MRVHRTDVVGQRIKSIRCAVSKTPGDMGGSSVSDSKTAILLENGIGIDLELHEPPLHWSGWPNKLKRDVALEAQMHEAIGSEVRGVYSSDFYPSLVVLIEGDRIIGMNSPAPWCVLPTIESIGKDDIADLRDFFTD